MHIVVLGGGRVGAAMVRDLALDEPFSVTLVDASEAALAAFAGDAKVKTRRADLRDPAGVAAAVADADLVLGAVPGHMGFATLKAVLGAGKNVVDISFFAEDAFELDALAREKGLTAVVDIGVAPGCSNLLLGRMEQELDEALSFACYVGGLPLVRRWPYEYKAPFSPSDVIEEYVRPARLRYGGQMVTRPALSDSELIDFPGVGTLEAFVTDGLRSLLFTSKVPTLVEKTLRYPGHREKMEMLRETGFFGEEELTLRSGAKVRPVELASHLLFPLWQLDPREEELTVMRVVVEGTKDGQKVRHTFDLHDRTDKASGTSSMARTTGYTATAAVRLVAGGHYRRPGISPPEFLGREANCCQRIFADLEARGVVYQHRVEAL